MANIDPKDEEAVLARAAEINTARAAAALAERREQYAPLIAIVDSAPYAALRDDMIAAKDAFATKPTIYNSINALAQLMQSLAAQIPTDARAA